MPRPRPRRALRLKHEPVVANEQFYVWKNDGNESRTHEAKARALKEDEKESTKFAENANEEA